MSQSALSYATKNFPPLFIPEIVKRENLVTDMFIVVFSVTHPNANEYQ